MPGGGEIWDNATSYEDPATGVLSGNQILCIQGDEETGVYYRLDQSNKRERPVYPAAAANTTILCVQIGALYIIILLHGVRQQVSTREKIKTSEGTGQCVMQYSNLNCLKNFIH
jgi:hypothetical protein